jgi:hypothetical protein
MDPITIAIATQVMNVLLPYVSKGAEEFASKVGDAAFNKVSALLSLIKKRWSGDPVATADLTRFEKNPEVYQAALKQTLLEKLTEDKDLASQVSQLLQEMGPSLEVIQKMEEGEDVTGLEAGELHSGTAKVSQDLKKGKNVTGAKIDRIG